LVLCLTLIGLWITIRSAAPPPLASTSVLTAARDLPAGRALTSGDLRTGSWPAGRVPSGRLTMAVGRTLASPIRAGELLTDARVIGPGLLIGQPRGTVAMPVRLGDPAAGALVRAGDRVDVLMSSSTSAANWSAEPDLADGTGTGSRSGAEPVVSGALVLAAPGAASADDSGLTGTTGTGLSGLAGGATTGATPGDTSTAGMLVLAVSSREATELAAVQSASYLTIAVLPPAMPGS
jgi:Flp pilus assembly protein CpaB